MKNDRTNGGFDSLLEELIDSDDNVTGSVKSKIKDNSEDYDVLDELMNGAGVGDSTSMKVDLSEQSVIAHKEVPEKTLGMPKRAPLFGSKKEVSVNDTQVSGEVTGDQVHGEPGAHVQHNSKEAVDDIVSTKETVDSTDHSLDTIYSEIVEDSGFDLLDELTHETIHEKASGELALDNKDYNIKVTPDGKTLSEIIPSFRKGTKTFNDMVKDIVDETKNIEADGRVYADGRYKKHIENIEKEKKYNEERKSLSSKFVQKNAKYTEQEKVIMRNLGITNEQFAKIMGKGDLSKREKEIILAAGKSGAEKHFKGRRYRTTVGDMALLDFLSKFKFANTRILRWIKDEPQGRTWRKLNRLRESGLVSNKTIIGIPDLWGATAAGVSIAGYSLKPGLQKMPKMSTVSATMGVNYLAACLWFNTVNVLNLEDFPASHRIAPSDDGGVKKVQGEMLVSELEIRSSLGKLISPQGELNRRRGDAGLYEVVSSDVRTEIRKWDEAGRVGVSPEELPGNEYMWVLYPRHQLTNNYHVPDLVVRRERNADGSPESIAVEVERYAKQSNSYEKIMRAYKLDKHLYKKVVWVTQNTQVAKQLKAAADAVGFDRYDIVPIITKSGIFTDGDIWMI